MEKLLSSSIPDPGPRIRITAYKHWPCPSPTWCWVPDSPWVWGWRSCWARRRVPGSCWPIAAPRFGFRPSSTQSLQKIQFFPLHSKWPCHEKDEGNQIHNFMSSSGSGTVIDYGSGSDFVTSYGSGSGSTSQKVTVPTVPVPQHWIHDLHFSPASTLRQLRVCKKYIFLIKWLDLNFCLNSKGLRQEKDLLACQASTLRQIVVCKKICGRITKND